MRSRVRQRSQSAPNFKASNTRFPHNSSLVSELWSPKTVARLNGYEVKVVRLNGDFTWHANDDTNELFLVTSGQLTAQMREGSVTLGRG